MPKGFNKKAIDGFMQWMSAMMNEANKDRTRAGASMERTKELLDKGFPKIRQ